jgi:hypothetical protein
MDENITLALAISDPELRVLENVESDAIDYRKPRHGDWLENYALSRDKVIINRLTQRQTVNIPLVKYVLNSLLKEMTDPPQLHFANLDNDTQKELFYNEHWKEVFRRNKLVVKDFVDKKQNAMYGRAFKKLNIEKGRVVVSLADPQDMLVSRLVDPTDIDSAPDLVECGIWTPLEEIIRTKEYDEKEVKRLKVSFDEDSPEGKMEADNNFQKASQKSERLKLMGVENVLDPVLGKTYIELHQAFRFEYDETLKDSILFRYVIAVTNAGMFKLHKISLEDLIGKTEDNFWRSHYPYTSWASDPEATDFWSDGVVDIVRPINNVLNVWISQLVENRTLQNFSMKYYDSTNKSFVPQTFQPQPWAHFPVPGDPNKIIKDVETGNLSGTLEEMTFLIEMAQKATAATNTAGGETTTNVTLGDIQMALDNAQKRIMMQKVFYIEDWKDLGLKYTKMLEAAGDLITPMKITRKGRLGLKYYQRIVGPNDWRSKEGYVTEIQMVVDQQAEDVETIQPLQVLKTEMPNNVPLLDIYHKKLMRLSKMTPDEIAQVEEFDKQNKATMPTIDPTTGLPVAQPGQPSANGQPAPTDMNANVPANAGASAIPQVPDIGGMNG